MKRFIFFLMLMLSLASSASAQLQQSLVATLTHGSEVQTFTGSDGFKQAMSAATHGDYISLSPGSFNGVDPITKAVTIRGAGSTDLNTSDATIAAGTTILNSMTISIGSEVEQTLSIIGVSLNGRMYLSRANNIVFKQCRISSIYSHSKNAKSVSYEQCRINDYMSNSFYANERFVTMSNTYVYFSGCWDPYINATNCVFKNNGLFSKYGNTPLEANFSTILSNCVFIANNSSDYLPNGSQAYNCVAYPRGSSTISTFFTFSKAGNNAIASGSVFNEETYPYDLTAEAAATYLGDDGTQVGVHGGLMPITPIVENVLVGKCNIASRTTQDGKLAVEIEVSSQHK